MQKLCQSEWERAAAFFEENDPILEYSHIFRKNLGIVERFGRFPDRNAVLARTSTVEEMQWLAEQEPKAAASKRSSGASNKLGRLRLFNTKGKGNTGKT